MNIYDVNLEMAILATEFYDAIYGRFQIQPRCGIVWGKIISLFNVPIISDKTGA